MDEDTSSRFVNSLVKSIQALCNGYIEFDTTIEVVGHIHLKIDRRKRLDYVLTEEVSKSLTEGATVFNSHSYHSHPPAPTKSPAESAQNQRKSNLNKNHENDPMALSSLPVVPNASKPDSHSASASRLGENSDSSHSGSYSGSHSQDTTISSAKADSLERRRKMAPSSHRTMSPTAKRSRNEDTSLRNSSLEVIEIKEEPEDEPAVYFGDNSQMGGSQDIQTPDFSNVVMESLDRVGQAEGTQLTGEAKPLAQPFPVMLHSNSMPSATASSSLPGQSSDPQSAPSTSAGPPTLEEPDLDEEPELIEASDLDETPEPEEAPEHDDPIAGVVERAMAALQKETVPPPMKYFCDECGKRYKSYQGFRDHKNMVHGTAKFQCPHGECQQRFTSSTNYEIHLLTHAKKKKFQCDACGSTFTYKKDLNNHTSAKHGNAKFTCTECNKSYAYAKGLSIHQKVVHQKSIYACPYCTRFFSYKGSLHRHMKTAHPDM